MIESTTKTYFWRTVEDCLVSFHAQEHDQAREKVEGLRERLQSLLHDIDRDIIYHKEPFDVANDLMGREVSRTKYHRAYDAIVRKNHPSHTVTANRRRAFSRLWERVDLLAYAFLSALAFFSISLITDYIVGRFGLPFDRGVDIYILAKTTLSIVVLVTHVAFSIIWLFSSLRRFD